MAVFERRFFRHSFVAPCTARGTAGQVERHFCGVALQSVHDRELG